MVQWKATKINNQKLRTRDKFIVSKADLLRAAAEISTCPYSKSEEFCLDRFMHLTGNLPVELSMQFSRNGADTLARLIVRIYTKESVNNKWIYHEADICNHNLSRLDVFQLAEHLTLFIEIAFNNIFLNKHELSDFKTLFNFMDMEVPAIEITDDYQEMEITISQDELEEFLRSDYDEISLNPNISFDKADQAMVPILRKEKGRLVSVLKLADKSGKYRILARSHILETLPEYPSVHLLASAIRKIPWAALLKVSFEENPDSVSEEENISEENP